MKKQDAKKIVRFWKLFQKLHMAMLFDLPIADCNIDRKELLKVEKSLVDFVNKNICKKFDEASKILDD